jgi:hypothetical protein
LTAKTFFFKAGEDISAWSLLAANLITITIAVRFHWNLLELMWLYWAQSVIIGVFNYVRIKRCGPDPADTANFFALHYGFFHFIYAIFLLAFTAEGKILTNNGDPVQWPSVLLLTLVFLLNHAFSFFYNQERDASKETPDRLMFFPYARIFPMHLTLIFGGLFTEFFPNLSQVIPMGLLFFLGLKTLADLTMHWIEHS